jgi:hypothetical protein
LCTQLGVTVERFAGFVRQAYALMHEGREPFLAWAWRQTLEDDRDGAEA